MVAIPHKYSYLNVCRVKDKKAGSGLSLFNKHKRDLFNLTANLMMDLNFRFSVPNVAVNSSGNVCDHFVVLFCII